jgi:hypothetical protein
MALDDLSDAELADALTEAMDEREAAREKVQAIGAEIARREPEAEPADDDAQVVQPNT